MDLRDRYLPDVENGGLFITTEKDFEVGGEVFLEIELPTDPGPSIESLAGSIDLRRDGTINGVIFDGAGEKCDSSEKMPAHARVIDKCDHEVRGILKRGVRVQFTGEYALATKRKIESLLSKARQMGVFDKYER